MLRFLGFFHHISPRGARTRWLLPVVAAAAAVSVLFMAELSPGAPATTADGAGPGGTQTLMFGDVKR